MGKMVKKTDPEIQQDVLRELTWDTRVDETEVGVQVKNGIVTLTGNVTSWAKKIAAQEAAHRVVGVMDVANDLEVKGAGSRSDTDLAQAVRRALEWDVFVPHERITSTVAGGVVTLQGQVDVGSQKDDAQRAIRNLEGVRGVNNLIEVKPAKVAPERVRSAIEDALERHAERERKRVKLDVHDGRVVLSGSVGSWRERTSIDEAVRATPGVRTLDNRIRVEPYAV